MFGYGRVCLGMAMYWVTCHMHIVYRDVTGVMVALVIYIELYCCYTSCYCWPGQWYMLILLRRSIIYKALALYIPGSVYGWFLYLRFHILYNVCPAFIWFGLLIDVHTRPTHSASRARFRFQVSFAFLVYRVMASTYIWYLILYITIRDAVYLENPIKTLFKGPYAWFLVGLAYIRIATIYNKHHQ